MNGETHRISRFSRVSLQNWRNFRGVTAYLQKRVFLVGPNASGKSNFLDAFRFMKDVVSVGGGFEQAIAKRGGVSRVRCLAARQNPDVTLVFDFIGENDSAPWTYLLQFAQDNRRRPLITREQVRRGGDLLLSRPDESDRQDRELLRQTHLEQVRANKGFRELSSFFSSIEYLHIVPQLVRDPDKYRGQSNDPYGWDFLEKISKAPEKTRQAWLRRIRDALQVAVPQLQDFELWRDERGVPHLRGKYEHWRPYGAWQTEESFSDGTLRLLGVLWAVLDGAGPLLLEEPEMSLHPGVVEFIPQMLARMQRRTGRQVFVSTHSFELLKDTGIGLNEVLLLRPDAEGTTISTASDIEDAGQLLSEGLTLADIVIPRTRPSKAKQLSLFGEK